MGEQANRSYESITTTDLRRLSQVARADREDFFVRKPKYEVLADRIICVALCQGAALHYVDGRDGVKDFDIWTFYAAHSSVSFPPRRNATRDFGDPKFGQSLDRTDLIGRRVDLFGRSVKVPTRTDPRSFIHQYLSRPQTKSARHLAQKAVVLLEPLDQIGTVAWPVSE